MVTNCESVNAQPWYAVRAGELMDGTRVEASCYNLPGDKIDGTNRRYAKLLLELAEKLQLPDSYLDQIRQVAGRSVD